MNYCERILIFQLIFKFLLNSLEYRILQVLNCCLLLFQLLLLFYMDKSHCRRMLYIPPLFFNAQDNYSPPGDCCWLVQSNEGQVIEKSGSIRCLQGLIKLLLTHLFSKSVIIDDNITWQLQKTNMWPERLN